MVTAIWLASNRSIYINNLATPNEALVYSYAKIVGPTSFAISLAVNAVVTGSIVLRIVKVYWKVRHTSEDRDLGIGGGNSRLRSIVFIIIESGMAMFSIQLVRFVLYILELDAEYLVVGINQMFNVIIQPVIFIFHLY